jgi:hypothetical protein
LVGVAHSDEAQTSMHDHVRDAAGMLTTNQFQDFEMLYVHAQRISRAVGTRTIANVANAAIDDRWKSKQGVSLRLTSAACSKGGTLLPG